MGNGQSIDGAMLIEETFRYPMRNKWADLGVVVAFGLIYRAFHYVLLAFNNRHYGESLTSKSSVEKQRAKAGRRVASTTPHNRGGSRTIMVSLGLRSGRAVALPSERMPHMGSRQASTSTIQTVASFGDELLTASVDAVVATAGPVQRHTMV